MLPSIFNKPLAHSFPPQSRVMSMTEYRIGEVWQDSPDAYQDYVLPLVSRTFALTIPQLPAELARVIANAYLLCRIADTVEDEPSLEVERKQELEQALIDVVAARGSAETLAGQILPGLSSVTLPAEHDLVRQLPLVIAVTHSFGEVQRRAIARCIGIMGRGMHRFQLQAGPDGLSDLKQLDSYCYFVAGVVGEMLTELFCAHSPQIAVNADLLQQHSVSFGQGLQMTNILKDQWDDRSRGVCWLPREVFLRHGVDTEALAAGRWSEGYREAMREMIGVAHAHLRNALSYTLAIPAEEVGIRRFCLWAVGLALLTLRNIHRKPEFTAGSEVKVSRKALATTIMMTNMAVGSDAGLTRLFNWISRDLPLTPLADSWSAALTYSATEIPLPRT